ncbi:hypothetical protein D3C76_957870 [compost metagenome]
MHRQQLGAGGAAAAIELDAVQAEHVHADADGARGEAGSGVEDEALGPFLGLALGAVADEVAVQVEVAQVEVGLGVFEETAVGGEGGQAGCARQNQEAGQDAGGGWNLDVRHCGGPFYIYGKALPAAVG